jgi:hypothetical protein
MSVVGIPTVIGGVGGIQLLIGGVNRSENLLYTTTRITRQLSGRATCNFEMTDAGGTAFPTVGQIVKITDSGYVEFAGTIDTVTAFLEESTTIRHYQIACVDFAGICDHRLVAQDYPQGTSYFLVIRDILATALSGENITMVNVSGADPLPADVSWLYRKVTDVFNELRDISSDQVQWWIDFNRDLHFTPLSQGAAAPFNIEMNDGNWRNLQVLQTRTNYRNVQYVRTSQNLITTTRTETITSYAGQTSFPTVFSVALPPVVKLDGVPVALKAAGVDPGWASGWYWIPNGIGVFFLAGIPAGHTVEIDYGSLTLNVVSAQNDAEIASRAAAEGGSGRYEEVWEQRDLPLDQAQQIANGMLAKAIPLPRYITYETDIPGLEPGMLQLVNIPELGLNNVTCVVDQMDSQSIGSDLGRGSSFRRKIQVNTNGDDGNAFTWIQSLLARTEIAQPNLQHQTVTLASTGGDLATGVSVSNPGIIDRPGTLTQLQAAMSAPPVGAPVQIDMKINGVSAMAAGKYIEIPPSASPNTTVNNILNVANGTQIVDTGDVVTFDVVNVGNVSAGQGLTVKAVFSTPK